MFNKLTFSEKAKLYGALETLENKYGSEEVEKGLRAMAEILDGKTFPVIRKATPEESAYIKKEYEIPPEQLTWEPTEKKKRNVIHRNRPGLNDEIIKRYFGDKDPEEEILKMYYLEGMKQSEIGNKIGVKQRSISLILNKVSEKKKRRVLSGKDVE